MAWFVQPLERKDEAGQASGLWHLTASSDEGGGFVVGCDHDHSSAEEAGECEDARVRVGEATGFPYRRTGERIELWRLESHPLARKFYDLGRELDSLPGDVRQTALMSKLEELKRETQALLDDDDYRANVRT